VLPFTEGEIEALRAAAPDWFAVALTLGLGAGLRQAEATGLTLDQIDVLRRELTVDRKLISLKAGEMRWGPQVEAVLRTVPLADTVVQALARHVELQGVGDHGLVLHGPDRPGRGPGASRVRPADDASPGGVARGAVPRQPAHVRFDAAIGWGVGAGGRRYLGHTPAVLLSTYAHLLPAEHDRARQVVEAAFSESWRATGVSPGSVSASTPQR
jgi:integrase